MTRWAKTDEVRNLIRFLVVIAEGSERDNMMNIKFSAKFLFAYTAMTTLIAVSFSDEPALEIPVWAVIIFVVFNVAYMVVAGVPGPVARLRAKDALSFGVRHSERIPALLALLGECSLFLSISQAFRRTVALSLVGSVSALKSLAAMFARSLKWAVAPLRAFFSCIRATFGAVFSGSAVLVLEIFSTVFTSELLKRLWWAVLAMFTCTSNSAISVISSWLWHTLKSFAAPLTCVERWLGLAASIPAFLRAKTSLVGCVVLNFLTAVFASEVFEGQNKPPVGVDRMLVEGIQSPTGGVNNNSIMGTHGQLLYTLDTSIIHETGAFT